MNNLIIGLDLDSVIANTEVVIHKYVRERFGIVLNWEEVDRFELEYFPGFSKSNAMKLKEEIESGIVLMEVEPYHYSALVTNLLKEFDFQIFIITSRPAHLREPTIEWLKLHNIAYDDIFLTRSVEKHVIIKDFEIAAFVEDRDDTLASIKENCGVLKLGLYLVDYPWNRNCKDASIMRVANLSEAVTKIIKRRRELCL